MKARHLTYGSYVRHVKTKEVIRVMFVNRKKIGYHPEGRSLSNMYYLTLDMVEPLPLTTEMLSLNGFVRESRSYTSLDEIYVLHERDRVCRVRVHDDDQVIVEVFDGEMWSKRSTSDVHEVQMLLCLAGMLGDGEKFVPVPKNTEEIKETEDIDETDCFAGSPGFGQDHMEEEVLGGASGDDSGMP